MRKPDLHLVEAPDPEGEHPLGAMLIRNTVSLVVARAAIRVNRAALLLKARAYREIMASVETEVPEPDRVMAHSMLYGKQCAYREAARMLRGKDR